jgi:hypothetical protein
MTKILSTWNLPPAMRAVTSMLMARGYQVFIRRNRSGSIRYSVDGAPETDAYTLMGRFERGRFPVKEG